MRRVGRWVLNTATGLSLLLCVVPAASWVRSYFAEDRIVFRLTGLRTVECVSVRRGRTDLEHDLAQWRWLLQVTHARLYLDSRPAADAPPLEHTFLGVSWNRAADLPPGMFPVTAFAVPHGDLVALFAILPAIRLFRKVKRRQRLAPGHCNHCGYDLRATPDRCPECGTIPAVKK